MTAHTPGSSLEPQIRAWIKEWEDNPWEGSNPDIYDPLVNARAWMALTAVLDVAERCRVADPTSTWPDTLYGEMAKALRLKPDRS